jgi:hypothetical protein
MANSSLVLKRLSDREAPRAVISGREPSVLSGVVMWSWCVIRWVLLVLGN